VRAGRRLVGAAMAIAVAAIVCGAAASLGGLNANSLGADDAAVASCDGNGVTVAYTVVGGNVTEVTVSDIAAGCVGGQLSLTLANSSGTSIGSGGPVSVTLGSHIVVVSPQPAASAVAAIHIVITGP